MKKSDIRYLTGCAFAAATSVAYCCISLFGIKLPRYYPTEHVWRMAKIKGVPSQGWYGMQAFAFAVGAIVAVIIYAFIRKDTFGQELKPKATRTVGIVATVVIVAAMAYLMNYEFDRFIY